MAKKLPKAIIIAGPTAAGKTKLGVKLAAEFGGEIVSADSRQVYKGMDIGSGKDLKDYFYQGRLIPYHLIDVVSPKDNFDLAQYQKLAFRALADISQRKKIPFLVGGSALYIEAVRQNYDFSQGAPDWQKRKKWQDLSYEELLSRFQKLNLCLGGKKFSSSELEKIFHKNKRRVLRYLEFMEDKKKPWEELFSQQEPLYSFLYLGITYPLPILAERIKKRLKERLENEDMLGEVERLHHQGVSWQRLENFGLEYKWLSLYLRGKISYQEMEEKLFFAIKHFAKRQMTWFRRFPEIKWVKDYAEARRLVKKFLTED